MQAFTLIQCPPWTPPPANTRAAFVQGTAQNLPVYLIGKAPWQGKDTEKGIDMTPWIVSRDQSSLLVPFVHRTMLGYLRKAVECEMVLWCTQSCRITRDMGTHHSSELRDFSHPNTLQVAQIARQAPLTKLAGRATMHHTIDLRWSPCQLSQQLQTLKQVAHQALLSRYGYKW